jgi:ABC-type multidrug transport system ATPase subunit
MKISLEHISKKFQRYWIFKDINYSFTAPGTYALLGSNGSGKSTLLRVLAGMQAPSAGKIYYDVAGKDITANEVFPYISFCAPGMEIVEELTLREFLAFHFTFKKPLAGITIDEIIELTTLTAAADKPIGDFSSGMIQRVKLAQAIFSNTPTLFLDEPCTNLDQAGVELYMNWIEKYTLGRLVIVASNDEREYFFCQEHLNVEGYKG